MKKQVLKILFILCISVGLTSAVFAQGRQTGSIRGTVGDAGGNSLPGVTVTVSSGALMGDQTYITTEKGAFRFPALPPGTYMLRVELPGFKTVVRENIIVRVGMTVTISTSLEMTTLEEEITVIAAAPTVDMQQSKVAVTMDQELLKNIPLARDLYDIVNSAPGVVSEENTQRRTSSVRGSSVRDNTYAFDGVMINDPVVKYPIQNINFDVMDEVEMIVGGHPAEVGYTEGAYVNVVTRSGGNKFSGGATIYYTKEDLTQQLWQKEQITALGVSEPPVDKSWFDGSFSVGGPILKDKLWFFTNARYIKREKNTNLIPWTDPLGVDHGPYDWSHTEKMGFIKLTSQLTSKLKVMGMFNFVEVYRPVRYESPGPYTLKISTLQTDHERTYTGTASLFYVFNQNTFVEMRGGFVSRLWPQPIQPEAKGQPYIRDYATSYGSFTSKGASEESLRKRVQGGVFFTHFRDNFLGGSHEFKGGVDFEQSYGHWNRWRDDNLQWYWSNGPYYYGTVTWNGVPNVGRGRIRFSTDGAVKGSTAPPNEHKRIGFYIQDSASIANRLNLNIGLRFDRDVAWAPATTHGACANPLSLYLGETLIVPYTQDKYPDRYPNGLNPFGEIQASEFKDIIVWNSISPRIGLTFDVFGNGKTALKASFSRYNEYLMHQYFSALHPFYPRSFTFNWYDTNFNQQLDMIDDYTLYPSDFRVMDVEFVKQQIDPDASSPITDEITLGIWHELLKNFSG